MNILDYVPNLNETTEYVHNYPDMVSGREVQVDADILCYDATYDHTKSFDECVSTFKNQLEHLRKKAAAQTANIYVTPKGSDKGGRYRIATVKEYQANRYGRPKPEHLERLRNWVIIHMNAKHSDEEADDMMTQRHHEVTRDKGKDFSVICSNDKDLRMNPYWHLDWTTQELVYTDEFGKLWYDEGRKKVLGYGMKFFWLQLLMGDTADNIPGLPMLHKTLVKEHFPTKAVRAATERLETGVTSTGKKCTEDQLSRARITLDNVQPKKVGEKTSYEYLSDCTNNKECFIKVFTAYFHWYHNNPKYTPWNMDTEVETTPLDMLIEQGRLLWMRRFYKEDFKDVIKEITNG